MNLNKLEIIVLLKQHKQVTAVANALGVKQPTVTFHMKSLEEEYGVQLFEARAGKVLLTEAGEALHHYAAQIQALAREARRAVHEFRSLERGTLRLGTSYVPGNYLLSGLLLEFSRLYPHIAVRLEIRTAPVIHDMLLNHSIDIGIISSEQPYALGLHWEPVMEDELVVVLPAGHPLAERNDVTPEELAREPFIFHDPQSTTRQMMLDWARQHEVSLHSKLELHAIEIIKRAVAQGQGITFMSRLPILEELRAGTLASIPIPRLAGKRMIYCGYHQERWLTGPMRAFLKQMRDGLQGNEEQPAGS